MHRIARPDGPRNRNTRRRTLVSSLAAAALGLGALLFPTAAQAAGPVISLCAWTQAPTGFVDISWYRNSSCPGSGLDNTAHYAQYVAADPIGTTLRACTSSAIPTGWFASGAGFYTSSCQITPGGLPPNTVWIKRLY